MIISDQAQHQTSVRVCATLLEQLPATRSVVVSKRANEFTLFFKKGSENLDCSAPKIAEFAMACGD
jgi:hypothetical protein